MIHKITRRFILDDKPAIGRGANLVINFFGLGL
jgi:hypothetical protein